MNNALVSSRNDETSGGVAKCWCFVSLDLLQNVV